MSIIIKHKLHLHLYWLITVGVLFRLVVALFLGNETNRTIDEYSYSVLGARLASGHGYSFAIAWYPFTPPNTATAHWSFLYTALIAANYLVVGNHPLVVRMVQAILGGLLVPWLTYRLSARLFPERPQVATVAAACAAIYAYFILYAAQLMTETFYIAALLWSMERSLALSGAVSRVSATTAEAGSSVTLPAWHWKTAITLGTSLGLAVLLRQSVLPWVFPLFGWLAFTALLRPEDGAGRLRLRMRRLGLIATASMVMLFFILPFTLRNYKVYGKLLLLNSNAGYAMYSAQHPMHETDFQAFTAAPLPDDLLAQGLNEAEWDRELMHRGIGFVLTDPVRYLRLSTSRVLDLFEFWPTDTTLLHNAGRLLSFTLLLPFYVAGLWLAIRRAWKATGAWWRILSQPEGLLLLFMVFYALLHIFTWAMPRYRLPIDAVAMPFAALAIAESRILLQLRLPGEARRGSNAEDELSSSVDPR
jgi:hypothetical protein